jgi:hypothetical protein
VEERQGASMASTEGHRGRRAADRVEEHEQRTGPGGDETSPRSLAKPGHRKMECHLVFSEPD